MKRWALLVAILYALILALLALPVILICLWPEVDITSAATPYITWQWWLILALMGLAQAALLAVPVRVASRRPMARIPLIKTVLVAALMMAGLVVGAFLCIYEVLFFNPNSSSNGSSWTVPIIGIASWCGWGIVFFRLSQRVNAEDLTSRLCRYLLKGSILELLIAVPTHIVARCRDYCCAGFMTFIGLTLGMAVMLFSFGPGVFFLFVARWRRLHPEQSGDRMGP